VRSRRLSAFKQNRSAATLALIFGPAAPPDASCGRSEIDELKLDSGRDRLRVLHAVRSKQKRNMGYLML
jgi:hypothetical protein